MDVYPHLYSEEDIRTKVVTAWLMNHGFGSSDISVEYSFEIRLGRKILSIDSEKPKNSSSQIFRPRADILVRSHDGKNLLIVEVKAPNEPIDDNVKEQGICYARLLRKGGIAPFVVLTNGYETKIYDSVTEELINGTIIPFEHPYVKAGFRVNIDDVALRAEALETFISLSSENLIEFCRQQVSYHMRFLRDDDPYSGKKYIPSLYIERQGAMLQLTKLLDKKKQRVVIVTGPPQVGKTNFISHTVEKYLDQGLPCLFYPAIGMEKGLLGEICDDFEWILGEGGSAYNLIHRKLRRILGRTSQKLTIFIDGWNETNTTLARTIDRESERLACYDVVCVISMTNIAANRLLKDEVGNPSHIAEATGFNTSTIPLIEISPEKQSEQWSKVSIEKYTNQESVEARLKYAKVFNVQTRGDQFIDDPFLLRIGMEAYQGQVLPNILDEPILLEHAINEKAKRARDLQDNCVPVLLSELADEMLEKDAPLPYSVAMKRWGLPIVSEPPKGLFEAAILTREWGRQGLPSLDFYYSRERNFVIACWTRNWINRLLGSQEAVLAELSFTSCHQLGIDALRWFLKQPEYESQFQSVTTYFSSYKNPLIKRVLLSVACEIVRKRKINDESWMNKLVDKGVSDSNALVKVEAAKIIIAMDQDTKEILDAINDTQGSSSTLETLIFNLLAIEEEYPLEHLSVSNTVLDALRHLHWTFVLDNEEEESEVTIILVSFIGGSSILLQKSAAKALGYISPQYLLRHLTKQIESNEIDEQKRINYIGGIKIAVSELQEMYYGSMCPGWLDSLKEDEEQLLHEYLKMCEVCKSVIAIYSSKECGSNLLHILESLEPKQEVLAAKCLPTIEQLKAQISDIGARRYQLPLPFNTYDTNIGGN